jgi:hypothetical protein
VVHHAVEAVGRPHRRSARTVLGLIGCAALLAGCGASASSKALPKDPPAPGVASVRQADCNDWKKGNLDQRRTTVAYLRQFAGGPVGSSAGIQNGHVLDDGRAYRVLESYCTRFFARGFKLYKLYERAAAFVGHAPDTSPTRTEPLPPPSGNRSTPSCC